MYDLLKELLGVVLLEELHGVVRLDACHLHDNFKIVREPIELSQLLPRGRAQFTLKKLQGYLVHKKPPHPRTLQ